MNKTIVNGIDISKCEFSDGLNGHVFCCCGDLREGDIPFRNLCEDNQNCYFKQLARAKKENVEFQKDCPKVCKLDKYKQALDEIAERENSVCNACTKFTPNKASSITCGYCEVTQIRNIINKVEEHN